MIEGFEKGAFILVNLVNPKEKFFGILSNLSAAGLTIRAINLDSFDDWINQIARGEDPDIDLMTMFVPLFRVERIFLDEASGAIRSYSQRFHDVVGKTVSEYLGI